VQLLPVDLPRDVERRRVMHTAKRGLPGSKEA
jgi:hypothetical protein